MPATHPAAALTGENVGLRLRELRRQQRMSARELARLLDISPSAVSQIERGVMQPSVSRLIAITDALGVPLAAVFSAASVAVDEHAGGVAVLRGEHSTAVTLSSGVTFRRLSPGPSPGVDYFESIYPPGAAAHAENDLFRHEGYEVGNVLAGELTIDFDDERLVLRPGDSVSYPCSRPHRLHNTGTEPAVAQWLIVHPGRGDAR